ncbi:hypothetical protein GQX74_001917 [Glossina fuscipes]|nr:hypothetical protein GQX74_001917 [Glossina fuscipes]
MEVTNLVDKIDEDFVSNQSCEKKLFDLNEDCLREIFQYLNLAEQNRMRKLCPLFDGIVKSLWENRKNVKNLKNLILDMGLFQETFQHSVEEFQNYLSSVSVVPIDVQFNGGIWFRENGVHKQELLSNVIRKIKFPNVQTLSFMGFKEDMILLKSFPNLKKLRLTVCNMDLPQWNSYYNHHRLNSVGLCERLEEILIHYISARQDDAFFEDLASILKDRVYSFAGPFYMINSCRLYNLQMLTVYLDEKEKIFQLLNLIKISKALEVLEIHGVALCAIFLSELENILASTRTLKQPLIVNITRRNYEGLQLITVSYLQYLP